MTHPNEALSPLNGDAGVAQVGDARIEQLLSEVSAIEPSRRISMSSTDRLDLISIFRELLSRRAANTTGTVKSDTPFGHEYGEGPKLADMIASLEPASSVEGEEPVALDRDMVMLSASERACYEYPDDQGKRAAFIFGAALYAGCPSPAVSAEVTDEMAMACDEWPSWLSEAVERTNEFADRADASTEQAVAFGILSILGGGK